MGPHLPTKAITNDWISEIVSITLTYKYNYTCLYIDSKILQVQKRPTVSLLVTFGPFGPTPRTRPPAARSPTSSGSHAVRPPKDLRAPGRPQRGRYPLAGRPAAFFARKKVLVLAFRRVGRSRVNHVSPENLLHSFAGRLKIDSPSDWRTQ